jgi:hypothetical protein
MHTHWLIPFLLIFVLPEGVVMPYWYHRRHKILPLSGSTRMDEFRSIGPSSFSFRSATFLVFFRGRREKVSMKMRHSPTSVAKLKGDSVPSAEITSSSGTWLTEFSLLGVALTSSWPITASRRDHACFLKSQTENLLYRTRTLPSAM